MLRSRLIDNKASKAKLRPLDIAAITIKSWNAMRAKQVVKTLRWRTDGDSPEPFPEIK